MGFDECAVLALSGIQHYLFCPRQWGLIELERAWADNALTAEGTALHDRAHDEYRSSVTRGVIVERSLPLTSERLGVSGVADVVEFRPEMGGVQVRGHSGSYSINPVEYKRGRKKSGPCDAAQVCLQAMCLEEMFGCAIDRGSLFYWEVRRRDEVLLTAELRETVVRSLGEMRRLLVEGAVPPPLSERRSCKNCSLREECMPEVGAVSHATFRIGVLKVLGEEFG